MTSLDVSPPAPSAPAVVSVWTKLLWKIGGVDEDTLHQCPDKDWKAVKAAGEIFVCTFIYQATLWIVAGHLLFAAPGQIRPDIIFVGLFLATFVLLVDSWMFMRSGWEQAGLHELQRGGIDCGGGRLAHLKRGAFLVVRVGLAVANAQLMGVFFSLLIFAGDINSKLQSDYLAANSHLVAQVTTTVDSAIQRATDSVGKQIAVADKLSKQVSALQQGLVDPAANDPDYLQAQRELEQLLNEKTKAEQAVSKAEAFATDEYGGIRGAAGNSGKPGRGVRYSAAMDQVKNSKAHADEVNRNLSAVRVRIDAIRDRAPEANQAAMEHSRAQLPGFEGTLSAENAKLASLKKELDDLIAGRENTIRTAIESAPDHVPFNGGFLSRFMALEHISADNPKLLLIVILIDVCSVGFELAGVLSKITAYVPTKYSVIIARDSYMQAVRIAEEMMAELKTTGIQGPEAPGIQPSDDPFANDNGAPTSPPAENANGASAPKRGRGRPRKNPLPPDTYNPQ